MFKMKKKILAVITATTVGVLGLVGCSKNENETVNNKPMKVTLVMTEGGVNDGSFNQSAWEGAKEAAVNFDVEVNYLECKQKSEYATNIETAVDIGSDLIIGVGYEMSEQIQAAAKAYPEQDFAIVDGSFEETPANVKSILFDEEGAGYAVGLIAGKMTETNKLGFIGGMDIPSVSNFAKGFKRALKEVDPKNELTIQYANSFTDAAKGRAIAQQMINSNVDIIFTAGGGVNNGVIESSKEVGTKVIGVDMPMSHIEPDTIITSAVKNVGTGVALTIKDLVDGKFVGGISEKYSLLNHGVGYEDTKHLTDEIRDFVEEKISK